MKYVTEDGQTFTDFGVANQHEAQLERKKALAGYIRRYVAKEWAGATIAGATAIDRFSKGLADVLLDPDCPTTIPQVE